MEKKIKTAYHGHEGAYRNLKAQGKSGWRDGVESYRELLDHAFKQKYVPESGKFLELGCGAGETALWFAEKGYETYGVDISPTAIEWAREKAAEQNLKADFRVENVIESMGYDENYFDLILDAHCLHRIIGEDRAELLNHVYHVLKKGGILLSETMCGDDKSEEGKEMFDKETRCIMTESPKYRDIAQAYLGMPDDILEEIRKAGFKILYSDVKIKEKIDMLQIHAVKV
ncbi:MAG: class I SAM-dependent methyltransferase [Candidatus Delongbacteria bacterium]|jgi:ubiquinone/menaquinone biosynthesis C-methylase UbiE|nr:class I SAM-dependent methyltransferase [Candidatus Delongbacteria bacterium]